jgi:predicted adenylyl cyclase CyaB
MSHEMEAKYRVADFEPIRQALQQAGATGRGQVLQTDTFWDRPDETYRRNGCGLRLRVTRALEGDSHGDLRPLITFKGPLKGADGVKHRREIETRLDDAEAATQLLQATGLKRLTTIQKKRSSWKLGRCLVELDELPLIGRFVEIEGPDQQLIEQARRQLAIRGEHIDDSYVKMLVAACEQVGQPARSITFDSTK